MNTSSPDPAPALVHDYVEFLSWVTTEIQLESGPLGQGLRGIAEAMAPRYARIDGAYQQRRPSEPELSRVGPFLSRFGPISGQLQSVRYLEKQEEIADAGKQLLENCFDLLLSICDAFKLPLPPARPRPVSFRGLQALVVSDLVGYTPRALAMLPAGMHLGDEGVLSFVNQLNEAIRQQLKGAFEDLGLADRWENRVVALTGDGAIVRFDRVGDAVKYARAVHARAQRFNDAVKPKEPHRHRVGIAWGRILLDIDATSGSHVAIQGGIPFIQAVRMEGAVLPDGTAVERGAWLQLLNELGVGDSPPAGFTEHADLPGKVGEPPYHGWVQGGVARPAGSNPPPVTKTEVSDE